MRRRLLSVVIDCYLRKSILFMEGSLGDILHLRTMAMALFPNPVVLKGEG